MNVLNDFLCAQCGTQKEHFVDNFVQTVKCQNCSGVASKVRSVPNFRLPGNDPAGFPTAADKWVKRREQKRQQELKAESQ